MYILVAYFLGNICAKNCRNRIVYVKIVASCIGGTFFLRHGVVVVVVVVVVDWICMNESYYRVTNCGIDVKKYAFASL